MRTLLVILALSCAALGQTLTDSNQNVSPMRLRTCMIVIGADNGSALVNADLSPQIALCKVPVAATIQEITVAVNNASSTTAIQLQKRHCSTFTSGACTAFTTTSLLSGTLAAAATAGADACAKSTISTACFDGTTSSGTVTISATDIAAGDYIETVSCSADGTTKKVSISITYQVN